MMFCVARFRRAGFTLIEIMIVIAIIAILAGIVVPNFVQAREEAKIAACRQNILAIAEAFETVQLRKSWREVLTSMGLGYASSSNPRNEELTDLLLNYFVENGYLAKYPVCPGKVGATVVNGAWTHAYYRFTLSASTTSSFKTDGFVMHIYCMSTHKASDGSSISLTYCTGGPDAGWRD